MKGFTFLCLLISIGAVVVAEELRIEVLEKPSSCQQVSQRGNKLGMLYRGALTNGKVFDSNTNRNNPFTFTVGAGQVIKGWDQGLLNMCVGEKRRLTIPSDLAYGQRGAPPDIPPRSTLVFDVELVSIG